MIVIRPTAIPAMRAARMFPPTSFEEPRQRLDTQFRIALTEQAVDDERGSDGGDLRAHAEHGASTRRKCQETVQKPRQRISAASTVEENIENVESVAA